MHINPKDTRGKHLLYTTTPLNWAQIDTVLLDMDGTLLDLHFDNYFWTQHLPMRYAQLKHINVHQAKGNLQRIMQAQQGQLNWYCLDYWSHELKLDIVRLKKEVKHLIKLRPYAPLLIKQLKQLGKHTVLVTNAHPKTLAIKTDITGIRHWFDLALTAHAFDQPKEIPTFWSRLQHRVPFDPKRTVLIDDSLNVLESARQFGIQHLLAIAAPDSQRQARYFQGFSHIHHFDEILPIKGSLALL